MRPQPRNTVQRSDIPVGDQQRTYIDDRPTIMKRVCHGDPDRCLRYKGRLMPLCARCFGFYIGVAVGLPWGVLMSYMGMDPLMALVIFTVTTAPLAVDGVTQYMGWRRSNNRFRLMTGLSSGFGGGMGASYLICMVLGVF